MNRPKRSLDGYFRSLQMSKYQLFIFVEGKESDSFVYGKMSEIVCSESGILRQIRSAKELPTEAGGKMALLEFHQSMRKSKKLFSNLSGKKTAIAFIVDKDVDDLTKSKRKCGHLIYTKYYDIQNHIFKEGDFVSAVSAAASIDPNIIREHPVFSNKWCKKAAQRWEKWVALCLFSNKHKIQNVCNYRVCSKINNPINGIVDEIKYKEYHDEVIKNYAGTELEYETNFKLVESLVNKLYSDENHDVVFKGKWYPILLESDLRDEFGSRDFHLDRFSQRINSTLSTTMNFSGKWVKHFTVPLNKLVLQLIE